MKPLTQKNWGHQYSFVFKGEEIADPNSYYLPVGSAGKISSLIDQEQFDWGLSEQDWLRKGRPSIRHIKKVHVGISSETENLLGLTNEILKANKSSDQSNPRFRYLDSIELLPINEFSGRGAFRLKQHHAIYDLVPDTNALGGWGSGHYVGLCHE
jgi:1,4-alpha-glucan branching enzyme